MVITGGDDALTIGAEGGRKDVPGVADEGAQFGPGGGIPDLGGPVGTGGNDTLTIGAEGGGKDSTCVAGEDEDFITS